MSSLYYSPNPILDQNFTEEEIKRAIRHLKNNKSSGIDEILNEYLINSTSEYIKLYTELFNVILKCGIIPEEWSFGIIKPLYKGKGSRTDPNNYRGITIISCLSELFTSVINMRLTKYVNTLDVIGPEQAGFRSGFSTNDHIFALKMLIDLFLHAKKILYVCFVDYAKTFDSVNRVLLWQKLLACQVNGNMFRVINNLYLKAKTRVLSNDLVSTLFPCQVGARQGGNLSPLLFSIYLSDLKEFLSRKCDGLNFIQNLATEFVDDAEVVVFLKLHLLLYADDTVILAVTPNDLQIAFNSMAEYCKDWKLSINVTKTQVMMF